MTVYYAHFMGIYNTIQEKRDLQTLKQLGLEIVNPNDPTIQAEVDEYKKIEGFDYNRMFEDIFLQRVYNCDVFAFRALPDTKISYGVYRELQCAQNAGKTIIELPSGVRGRVLDGEATRDYLKELGQR